MSASPDSLLVWTVTGPGFLVGEGALIASFACFFPRKSQNIEKRVGGNKWGKLSLHFKCMQPVNIFGHSLSPLKTVLPPTCAVFV